MEDFRDYARSDLALFKEVFEKASVSFVEPGPADPFGDLFPERTK